MLGSFVLGSVGCTWMCDCEKRGLAFWVNTVLSGGVPSANVGCSGLLATGLWSECIESTCRGGTWGLSGS